MPNLEALINTLEKAEQGPATVEAIDRIKKMKEDGCTFMSLGTFMPGEEPRSWEEWAKAFNSLDKFLSSRTPEQVQADLRAGEDFLLLDSALCERDNLLNYIAKCIVKKEVPNVLYIHDMFSRAKSEDALRYFNNSLHLEQVLSEHNKVPG